MAKNPKVKDPIEGALSAVEDALNFNDLRDAGSADRTSPDRAPAYDDPASDLYAPGPDAEPPRFNRSAANDDREAIGVVLQAIQKGRPRRSAYTMATLFSGLWIVAAGFLVFAFLPSLEAIVGHQNGGALALIGLAGVFFAPLVLFYFLAGVVWRSQELSMIAQSMAQMAIRFSEPENIASGGIVNVGQAIRREVAAILRVRADRATLVHDDAIDVDAREHLATVILDAGDERIGQRAAATDGHAYAIRFEEADEHERADARGFLIRRYEVLAGDAAEMHANLVVLEVPREQVVRAHLHHPRDFAALTTLIHHRSRRALRHRRAVER